MIAIYARQSLFKKDSVSIETQIDACKHYFYQEKESEFKVYQDKGFSGKDINRPEFEKLLNDIESNRIGKLCCYKLDRISRNTIDFAKIYELCQKHKVTFFQRLKTWTAPHLWEKQ